MHVPPSTPLNMPQDEPLRDGCALSEDEDRALRERSNLMGVALVLHGWCVVLAAMAVFAAWPNPITFLVCGALIGGRQLGLSVLMHEAAHRVLMRHAGLNDWVGHWVAGGAVGSHLFDYRPYHLTHHRFTQQDNDPDLVLSAPFPITRAGLRRKVIRDLTGQTGLKLRLAQMRAGLGTQGAWWVRALRLIRHERAFLITNALLLSTCWALGHAWVYLWMWLLPLLTWFQLFSRVRNIAEHAVTGDRQDRLRNTRTTFANWFERALVAPYWVNYHLEHHLYAFVPCWKLARAHRLLSARGLTPQIELSSGYPSVLRQATART